MLLVAVMLPLARANVVDNPSMEGSFITQDPFGDVAEHWVPWYQQKNWGLRGDFSENSNPEWSHAGDKSQLILWDGFWMQNIGYDGMYQQVDSLQPGDVYRASVWFRGRYLGAAGAPGASLFLRGSIGTDPHGGASPDAVTHWDSAETMGVYSLSSWDVLPWCHMCVIFSPSDSTATVFVSIWGNAINEGWDYNPTTGTDDLAGRSWTVGAYIDDVVVEPVEIGSGSSVQATTPIAANGADQSRVTITILDAHGEPLTGIPDSEIVVECTGSNNTITGPSSDAGGPGVAIASIASRTAEMKTVTVTVFGRPLSDTPVVEFTGSFGPYWYVDADASGTDNGSSWTDAFNDLQDALTVAQPGDEIWVAGGTYTPGSSRSDTFQLAGGVAVRGGYAGVGAPDPNVRSTSTYETILSGDCNGDDGADFANNGDNSYHVVTGSNTDATAVLDGFTITAGNANGTTGMRNNGGGMLIDSGSPTLTNCTFTANAGDFGAGLGNYNASPSLTNCTFSSNHADTGGGGMANDAGADPTVSSCEFRNNSSEYGGGMRNHTSSPTVTNCTFSDNTADWGAAVRNMTSNAELSDCTFTGNAADQNGGGVFNQESDPALTDCQFTNNSAEYGGGISNQESSPTVTDCLFSGNAAGYEGGGVYNVAGGIPQLTRCDFTGNSAMAGGALSNSSSSATVNESTFTDNTATFAGGAMVDCDSSPILTNCAFSGNTGDVYGGALGFEASATTLVNCTFSGNSSPDGRAIVCISEPETGPSNINVTNCILWNGGDEISNVDGSTIAVTYSDVQGGWSGTGNINADPRFVSAGGGDYRLSAGSPCIDAGDNGEVVGSTDLDGQLRFLDDPATTDTGQGTPPIVDMGAYEFGDGASVVPVYRFWSDANSRHFYTTNEAEKNKLIDQYSHVWTYEGVAYYALPDGSEPGSAPVYRFWSGKSSAHVYTISETEKQKLIDLYSHALTYEGPAFYAYPDGQQPAGTSSVYRFWSDSKGCHFYTMSESEKQKLLDNYSHVWTYEGIAWHAHQ